MLPTTFALLFAAPLASALTTASTCSRSTTQTCKTVMATVPNWWPVFTYTQTSLARTQTLTGTSTVFSTTTVAAVPITVTTSSTSTTTVLTTAIPGTVTVSTTANVVVTSTSTSTTINTQSVVNFVTSTATTVSTSVVPTPAGFVDIYGSSGDRNYGSSQRRRGARGSWDRSENVEKRTLSSLLQGWLQNKGTTSAFTTPAKAVDPLQFTNPIQVNCFATISPICNRVVVTTSIITVTAAPSTITSTVRVTATATNIVIPGSVTKTITVSTSTSTATTTALVTSTLLTTVVSTNTATFTSTLSSYAACATSNVLGPQIANGQSLSHVYFYDSNAKVFTSSQKSPYDCCVVCQTGDNCQWFQYQADIGTCWTAGADANWCPNGDQTASQPAYFVYNDPAKVTQQLYVGNGVCGTVMNLGQEDN